MPQPLPGACYAREGEAVRCVAPQLFRHRETGRVAAGPCRRWRCPACARRRAAQWQALLEWVAEQGEPPTHFITLTLREPLPVYDQMKVEVLVNAKSPV